MFRGLTTITYSVDDVPALLRGWSDAHRAAPEELNSTLVLMTAFGAEMPAMAMGLVCFAGADQAAADAALAPLLALDNRISTVPCGGLSPTSAGTSAARCPARSTRRTSAAHRGRSANRRAACRRHCFSRASQGR